MCVEESIVVFSPAPTDGLREYDDSAHHDVQPAGHEAGQPLWPSLRRTGRSASSLPPSLHTGLTLQPGLARPTQTASPGTWPSVISSLSCGPVPSHRALLELVSS